jgi:hypothetical protein
MKTEKRIIIGQTEIAGLPISAPVEGIGPEISENVELVWRKSKDGGAFSLCVRTYGRDRFSGKSDWYYQEVPFVES